MNELQSTWHAEGEACVAQDAALVADVHYSCMLYICHCKQIQSLGLERGMSVFGLPGAMTQPTLALIYDH